MTGSGLACERRGAVAIMTIDVTSGSPPLRGAQMACRNCIWASFRPGGPAAMARPGSSATHATTAGEHRRRHLHAMITLPGGPIIRPWSGSVDSSYSMSRVAVQAHL